MGRLFFICATKSRASLFRKKAYRFLKETGYEFLVGIEESQLEEYNAEGEIENVVTYADNFGHLRSFYTLALEAQRRGAEFVFKIDDDVSGFTGSGDFALLANLPRFEEAFDRYPELGGIAFPYEQEFYRSEKKLFSHMNHRLQTSYIVRVEFFFAERRLTLGAFEDFAMFLEVIDAGSFTLLCPVNKIKCSPVGATPGGLQDGDRAERSALALLKIQKLYPGFNIGARQKPDKSWKVEPDLSKDSRLKKIPL